ncbi:hypothetical protein LDENG_00146570 [Lucifuga dentata]|nr:hypothetical protein LDENG_00146570 [Lucifuga dentata]
MELILADLIDRASIHCGFNKTAETLGKVYLLDLDRTKDLTGAFRELRCFLNRGHHQGPMPERQVQPP